jgi:hypothetical protein
MCVVLMVGHGVSDVSHYSPAFLEIVSCAIGCFAFEQHSRWGHMEVAHLHDLSFTRAQIALSACCEEYSMSPVVPQLPAYHTRSGLGWRHLEAESDRQVWNGGHG